MRPANVVARKREEVSAVQMPKSGSVGGSGTLACGDSAEDAHGAAAKRLAEVGPPSVVIVSRGWRCGSAPDDVIGGVDERLWLKSPGRTAAGW